MEAIIIFLVITLFLMALYHFTVARSNVQVAWEDGFREGEIHGVAVTSIRYKHEIKRLLEKQNDT